MFAYKYNNLNPNNNKLNNFMKMRLKLEILLIIYSMKLIGCNITKIIITFNKLV